MNIYKHAPGMPDDTAHANIFCLLASLFVVRREDIIAPTREADRSIPDESHEDPTDNLNEMDVR